MSIFKLSENKKILSCGFEKSFISIGVDKNGNPYFKLEGVPEELGTECESIDLLKLFDSYKKFDLFVNNLTNYKFRDLDKCATKAFKEYFS